MKPLQRRLSFSPASMLVRLILAYLIIVFILYPNINLLVNVFYKNGEFSTEVFGKIARSKRALRSMLNSFILAISMILSVNVVGTLIVLLSEYWQIKGARILKLGYLTSLIYGGVTLVTGYKYVYGSNGILTKFLIQLFPTLDPYWFTGYWAVIFIMTFACTSNHIIFLTNAVRGLDGHILEAAKNMGASGSRIFFSVVMPTLKPTFFAITILTFLTGLGAMSAPLIVGGPDFQTINPMIITFANSSFSREIAALLAVILGLATILLLTILNKVEKGGHYISISKTKTRLEKQKIQNPVMNAMAHLTGYVFFLIYMTPIVLIILFSFTESLAIKTGQLSWETFTLMHYKRLFTQTNAFKPYLVSIVYSLVAALLACLISIVVARIVTKSKHKTDALFEYSLLIPWLLPSTLIALGLMQTYDVPRLILGNKVLIGTVGLLLIAYVTVKLPFTFRMVKAAFFSIDDNLEEAAKCMGAGTFYTMIKVVLPVIFPAIISVVVLNFNGLLSDYDLTVFLYHPLFQPLGIVIKSASDEMATSDAQAMAFVYSVVLMVISSSALYLTQGNGLERMKRRRLNRSMKSSTTASLPL